MLKKMTSLFLILALSGTAYCSKKKKKNWLPLALIGSAAIAGGNGSITGRTVRKIIKGTPSTPLADVEVLADISGKTFKIKSSSDGVFNLAVSGAVRGSGTTAFFRKDSFAESARAITFDIPNLRVDLGDVEVLTQDEANALPLGTSDSGTGPIVKGQIIDDFTSNPLDQASVNISIASGTTLPAVTDSTGSFTIQNSKLKSGSSYNITVSKQNYLESSNVTVNITGDTNTVNGNPIRLYRAYGSITGTVIDDSGAPLAGVSISSVDSKGATVSGASDSSGNFTLASSAFLLGSDYTLSITKSGYSSLTSTVPISITGNNTLTPNPFVLTISGTISGTVGTASCGNVTLSFTDSNGNPVSTTVTGGSTYTLNNTLTTGQNGIKKGQTYSITAVSSGAPGCETAVLSTPAITEGTNSFNISLTARVACGAGNTCIAGKVVDASDTASALQGITVSTVDSLGTTRTATTIAAGTFSMAGTFNNGATFSLLVSAPGYTGATSTVGQTISVQVTVAAGLTHNITGNGDTTLFSTNDIKLYPIGISATIGASKKKFYQGVRQTYEKFLTEKWGFTVSGRDVTDLNTASSFYIHTDDVSQPPTPPGSYCSGYTYRHANIMAVNGNVSKGVIQESNNDPRACNTPIRGATGGGSDPGGGGVASGGFDPSHSVMYMFYVANTGSFTVTVTNAPYSVKLPAANTAIKIYNAGGTQVGSSAGTGTASVSIGSAGWYFAEIAGTSRSAYGFFDVKVTGPTQTSSGTLGNWTTNNLILSWYDHSTRIIHIAGSGESGSVGNINITSMAEYGKIIRGDFTATLRQVTAAGTTTAVTVGYFNLIRAE